MPIAGNLKELSLTDIIQVYCTNGNKARVMLANNGHRGTVYMANGQVIHAIHEHDNGEEAIYRLLRWKDGDFTIDVNVGSPEITIQVPWHSLLLQGMHLMDEGKVEDDDLLPNSTEQQASRQKIERRLAWLMTNLNGFISAHVLMLDGTIIGGVAEDDTFLQQHYVASSLTMLNRVRDTLTSLEAGSHLETFTLTEKYRFIVYPLDAKSRYYVRIVLSHEGSIGAARMYLADLRDQLLAAIESLAEVP